MKTKPLALLAFCLFAATASAADYDPNDIRPYSMQEYGIELSTMERILAEKLKFDKVVIRAIYTGGTMLLHHFAFEMKVFSNSQSYLINSCALTDIITRRRPSEPYHGNNEIFYFYGCSQYFPEEDLQIELQPFYIYREDVGLENIPKTRKLVFPPRAEGNTGRKEILAEVLMRFP